MSLLSRYSRLYREGRRLAHLKRSCSLSYCVLLKLDINRDLEWRIDTFGGTTCEGRWDIARATMCQIGDDCALDWIVCTNMMRLCGNVIQKWIFFSHHVGSSEFSGGDQRNALKTHGHNTVTQVVRMQRLPAQGSHWELSQRRMKKCVSLQIYIIIVSC